MNANMLKGAIIAKGMTQNDMAEKMGVSLSRFNAKINERRGAEFGLGELKEMKKILDLDARQMDKIFFQ